MQAFFSLLDMGLTCAISRETARLRGGVSDALSHCYLVRALESIFPVIALFVGGILFAASGYIAQGWLQFSMLTIAGLLVMLVGALASSAFLSKAKLFLRQQPIG